MQLDLRELLHYPGNSLSFKYELKAPEYQGDGLPPFDVTGTVKNLSGTLILDGSLEGRLYLSCDRCGEYFERPYSLEVSCQLSREESDSESVYTFTGDSVELDGIFLSELTLSMDMKTLCSEDCDGGDFRQFITDND